MKKQNRGITLIALVLTIIVLIILAGISINTLTGDNGILAQAEKAKNKTTEAEAIERISVEVAGSYGANGKIDIAQLNKNLKNINGLTYDGNELSDSNKITNLPITVRLNGNDINIDNTGKVEKELGIVAKIIANPTEYYGKKVINYKANENDTNTYRIFYVDRDNYFKDGFNTIYLKADPSESEACSILYDSSLTKVKEMNPLWAEKRKDYESSWNYNEKASAWLCDPSKWTKYCDEDKANYALGGPSIEMYVKSYNEAYKGKIKDDTKYPIGTDYRETSFPGYIYTIGDGSIDVKNYNSMYGGKSIWWRLASPYSVYMTNICSVSFQYESLRNANWEESSGGFSPLVCLKASFIPEVEE